MMQISDPDLVLGILDGAKYFQSSEGMDYKWVSILYRSLMTDYRKSLKNLSGIIPNQIILISKSAD